MFFKRIHAATLSEPVKSRDGCIYLFRGIRIIGWLPPKNRWRYLYYIWAPIPFMFSMFYMPNGFLINYYIRIKEYAPSEFLTSITACCNAYGSSIKCVASYYFLYKIIEALNILDRLDARCKLDSERLKIRRVVARCNYIFLIYTFIYCGFVGSTFLMSVYNGHPPWQMYNPFFDWQKSRINLWIQSIIEYIMVSSGVLHNQISDTYPVIYMLIMRTHLDILMERVRNLRSDTKKSEDENYEELVQCIIDHKSILEFCNTIRHGISITMFVQFLICGLVLGLAMVNTFFFSTSIWSGIPTFLSLIKQTMQTFPFAYTCDFVMEDCDKLMYELFHSNWTNAEKRYKKTLLLFLHNAQNPIIFMAMGIFQICIRSNLVVAKFAFTVITIAKEMNLAEKFN